MISNLLMILNFATVTLVTIFLNSYYKKIKKWQKMKRFYLLVFILFRPLIIAYIKTQIILDSLSRWSLAKAYYSLFQPEHSGCWCYYCHRKHMILRAIIDMRDNYKYLNGKLKLDEFEQKGSPYPFYEEWLKKTNCRKKFCLKKLYIINIICSNKFIPTFLIH